VDSSLSNQARRSAGTARIVRIVVDEVGYCGGVSTPTSAGSSCDARRLGADPASSGQTIAGPAQKILAERE
jgi:hypothetical protein